MQKTRISNTILEEKNKIEEPMLLNFKAYYKAAVSRKCGIGTGGKITRSIEQSREPTIRPSHSQPIFHKGIKTVQWSKHSLFNKWYWNNWKSTCKEESLETDLRPFTKINSKWITCKCKTQNYKISEINISET